ncbi:energy-coupling factor ABC transporter ATP-binding protein [Lysinibacillus sp. BW-2-10]|uniref:energy-coupling factor ABC transporter ATP-binding protein n=1 Tax=Lysinibacillus sp. BW-2-10 TaxID=2590030 RepID=UPI00117C2255|nr:ABC transporter ATP-binding protein [Lysinibacillus sp. BW-2-10]TSI06697.1 ABC transporter ATP-binding protein [Lysinibacillus sp. BW-2-10]
MTASYFSFEHVSFLYSDGTQAINDISLTIPVGNKIAILGENGSGKSTLFKLLMGLERPTKGTILFKGEPLKYNKSGLQQLRQQVGLVFQEADHQLFASTVKQDILYGPLNLNWSIEKVTSQVDKAIALTELEELENRPIHFLSGGQKKRVAIAGVYAMEPKVLILDEPTSSLDYYFSTQLTDYLKKLDTDDRTFLYSTHQINLVYEWADYYIVLHKGKVIYVGERDALFTNDALLQQAHIEKPWIVSVTQMLQNSDPNWENIAMPHSKEALVAQIVALQKKEDLISI